MESVLPLEVGVDVLVLVVQICPREATNIPFLSAVEVSHALPHNVCAKEEAPENMSVMSVTLNTSHLEMSPLNDEAKANMLSMFLTLNTSHLDMSPLNDDAPENMPRMVVTMDTSHLEMSPLNDNAE